MITENRKAVLKKRNHVYYEANKTRFLEDCRRYHLKNRNEILRKMRERYRRNRAYRLARQKKYYLEHLEERRAYAREYGRKNSDKCKEKAIAYRLENIEEVRARDRERSKERYRNPVARKKMDEWRKKNLPRMRVRLAGKILTLKKSFGGRCLRCGYDDCLEILQFDHRIPLFQLGRSGRTRLSQERLYGVIEHPEWFDLLCRNCHAIKSSLERQHPWTNTVWKYWSKRFQILAQFGAACQECGYDKNVLALEFDHKNGLNGQKRRPAIVDVPKNPEQFQLLCANCHGLKTLNVDRREGQAAS